MKKRLIIDIEVPEGAGADFAPIDWFALLVHDDGQEHHSVLGFRCFELCRGSGNKVTSEHRVLVCNNCGLDVDVRDGRLAEHFEDYQPPERMPVDI